MHLSRKVQNVFLFFEANEDSKSRLDHRALGFEPCKAEGFRHELVIDLDIGAYRILVMCTTFSNYTHNCYDRNPQARSPLSASVLFYGLAQRGPACKLCGEIDRGVRRTRRGQCEIRESHAACEMAVV